MWGSARCNTQYSRRKHTLFCWCHSVSTRYVNYSVKLDLKSLKTLVLKICEIMKTFFSYVLSKVSKSFTQLPSLWDSHVFFRRRPFFCVNLRLSHRLLNKWWRHLFACLFRCSLAFRNQTSMLIHCYSLSQTYAFPIQFHFTVEKSWDFLVIQN